MCTTNPNLYTVNPAAGQQRLASPPDLLSTSPDSPVHAGAAAASTRHVVVRANPLFQLEDDDITRVRDSSGSYCTSVALVVVVV